MQYFIKDLIDSREEGKVILEESLVKSSGSNGIVERAVQRIEGRVRVMYSALQDRLGIKIDARECDIAFLPEYAAYLMNRRESGKDCKTAHERIEGKQGTVLGIEFGEKLIYKLKPGIKSEKINARWEEGIFVGVRRRSDELRIATKEKFVSARSVNRIPVERRWSTDTLAWIAAAPWNKYKGDEYIDWDIPEGVPVEESRESSGTERQPHDWVIFIETKASAPRDFQVRKEDAKKCGYTRGCGGCPSWFKGLARQPHTGRAGRDWRNCLKIMLVSKKRLK